MAPPNNVNYVNVNVMSYQEKKNKQLFALPTAKSKREALNKNPNYLAKWAFFSNLRGL